MINTKCGNKITRLCTLNHAAALGEVVIGMSLIVILLEQLPVASAYLSALVCFLLLVVEDTVSAAIMIDVKVEK